MTVTDPMPATQATPDPRSIHWTRRLGYRLLPGEGYSYLLHMRPREWPIVAAHTFFGFLIAIPQSESVVEQWPVAVFGVLLYVILLNGGTLAINSAFDVDEGDIGYLDAPPPPPRYLFAFGTGLMLVGLAISAWLLPAAFTWIFAACVGMSLLYSVPPFRWKAVAGFDLAINAAGFGTLTALAGWTLADVPVPGWVWPVLIAFAPLFAALYPLTQIYQFEEDQRRGDRTLALVLGMRNSLLFALVMAAVAFALILVGLAAGPGVGPASFALVPAAIWIGLLLRWLKRFPTMSVAEHKRGMYAALRAWAITNIAVLAAVLGPYYF